MNAGKKQLDGKFELMHVVWKSSLSTKQKNLLNYLLALADADGACYPNTDTLCKVTSVKNQKRFSPVVDQLPGLVDVDKQGRKNYYRVNLPAVWALEEQVVVRKVTPNPFADTPPTGANTPLVDTNTPPSGGLNTPLTGGANTTANTTVNTTRNTTLDTTDDSAKAPSSPKKAEPDRDDHESLPPSAAMVDSLIGCNDLVPECSPIAINEQEAGAAAAGEPTEVAVNIRIKKNKGRGFFKGYTEAQHRYQAHQELLKEMREREQALARAKRIEAQRASEPEELDWDTPYERTLVRH